MTAIDTLLSGCKICTACPLHLKRTADPVTYRGDQASSIMLVGEAPGKVEEAEGLPFAGPAGKKLEEWFNWIGYSIDDIYITNVAKCRPAAPKGSGKQNTTPSTADLLTCKSRFLLREIDIIDPKLIILCGKSAAVALGAMKPSDPVTPLFGTTVNITFPLGNNFRLWKAFILRHPASILYNRGNEVIRKEYIKSFQTLKKQFNTLLVK